MGKMAEILQGFLKKICGDRVSAINNKVYGRKKSSPTTANGHEILADKQKIAADNRTMPTDN